MNQKTAICLIFALLLIILSACSVSSADAGAPTEEQPFTTGTAISDVTGAPAFGEYGG